MEAADRNKNRPASEPSEEVERLKEELRHEHDMYLRALADFENYRRRVERDRSTEARSGKRDIILPRRALGSRARSENNSSDTRTPGRDENPAGRPGRSAVETAWTGIESKNRWARR